MAALPRHQDGGSPVFVATVLLLALLLVLSASRCSASCELCYDTGNCSSAVGPGIPGFFCSVTLSNSSNASSPVLSYTCCGLTQACTATPSVPIAYCASSPPSSSGAPAAPTTSSSPSASDVMSEVFIGLSLLLAGFLLLMTLFMGAALLWMAAAAWRRRLREGRRLKSVMPVEGEEEQRERQRREQTEREQRQQEEERREEARQKEQRRRDEQAQLQAVLERARLQLERKRRRLRDEAAEQEEAEQQRQAEAADDVQMVSMAHELDAVTADDWSSDDEQAEDGAAAV